MSKILRHMKAGAVIQPNPVKQGLLLWYDFAGMRNTDEDKAVAHDWSGNGHHGNMINFVYAGTSGYQDGKLVFDGVDDRIEATSFSRAYIGDNTRFNFDFVIHQTDNTSKGSILTMPFLGHRLSVKNSGDRIAVGRYTSHWYGIKTGPVSKGINHFSINVTLLADEEYGMNEPSFLYEFFVNGTKIEGEYASSSDYYSNVAQYLQVGWQGTNASQTENAFLNEAIYNVKIYNRILSATEVAQNYAIEKQRYNL